MSKPKRRRFTAERRATILRRHLGDKIPVSDLCDEYGIQPSPFYNWQRQMLEKLALALEDGRHRRSENTALSGQRSKVESLEAKLFRKNEVIAEISQEVVTLKERLGRPERIMGTARYPRLGRRKGAWRSGERRRERPARVRL